MVSCHLVTARYPSPSIARSGRILPEPTEAVGGAVRAETQTDGRPWRIAIRIESDGRAALGTADGLFHSASLPDSLEELRNKC